MTDKETMAMALEVLECANSLNRDYENEIAALKERLTQPPQRTEPPQKKVWTFWDLSGGDITDAIKAKLKEKNT